MEGKNDTSRYLVCLGCWKALGSNNPPILGRLDEGGRVIIIRFNARGGTTVIDGSDLTITCPSCQSIIYEKHELVNNGVRFFDLRGAIIEPIMGGTYGK